MIRCGLVTHNVIIDAEEGLGERGNILSGETNIVRPSAKTLRALLWAALKRAGAKYTLEQAGEFIHPGNLVMIRRQFFRHGRTLCLRPKLLTAMKSL
jgi:hypothetical protein